MHGKDPSKRPNCNNLCNLIQRQRTIREKTMPRIRKIERTEKSATSRKPQKNKTKHNILSTDRDSMSCIYLEKNTYIHLTCITCVYSMPCLCFIHPVSYLTHATCTVPYMYSNCPAHYMYRYMCTVSLVRPHLIDLKKMR